MLSLLFLFSLAAASVMQFQKNKVQRGIASAALENDGAAEWAETFEPADAPVSVIDPVGRDFGGGMQLQRAVLTLSTRQSFLGAVREVLGFGGGDGQLFEAGQQLSPEFRRAISPETQRNLCGEFIDENGEYGDLGRMIVYGFTLYRNELAPLIDNAAANKAGMKTVCPRFNEMSPDERKDFWVWTLATVALFESTCGYDTVNEKNRHAVGMFQLHESTADREPRALIGNGICGRLTREQIAPASNNTACALDFMRDSFSGRISGAPAGLLTDAQQFERLRNNDATIIKVLKKFKVCQATGNI